MSEEGRYNIISCRHFDDILFRHGGTRKPGVLLIYSDVHDKIFLENILPDVSEGDMYVLFYNKITYKSNYTLNRILIPSGITMDQRFGCFNPPCLYIFPHNVSEDKEFKRVNENIKIEEWRSKIISAPRIEVTFINFHTNTVRIYFEGHERLDIGLLEPGLSMSQLSQNTHIFSADDISTGKTIGFWLAGEIVIRIVPIDDKKDNRCTVMENNCAINQAEQYREDEIFHTLVDNSYSMMYHINTYQPVIVAKRFTSKGYKKIKLPKQIHNKVIDFYMLNKNYKVLETPDADLRPYLNIADVSASMIHISTQLQDILYHWAAKALGKWVDIDPSLLIPTFCYGIRMYHPGAILRRHIDKVDSHVLSVIIQVDQEVHEDWVLTVIPPKSEEEINITMQAGDAFLYESANVLHGRPYPLNGTYSNIFIHFKPKGWNYEYYWSPNGWRIKGDFMKEKTN